jgi:hypothetical protein
LPGRATILCDQGEADRLAVVEYGQRRYRRVHEPAAQLVGLPVADLAHGRKDAGVQQPEVIQVLAVHTFDPAFIGCVGTRIPHCDCHVGARKKKSPDRICILAGLLLVRVLIRTQAQ